MNLGDLLLLIIAIALFSVGYAFVPESTPYLVCVMIGVWAGLFAVRFDRPRRARAVAIGAVAGAAAGALLSFLFNSAR